MGGGGEILVTHEIPVMEVSCPIGARDKFAVLFITSLTERQLTRQGFFSRPPLLSFSRSARGSFPVSFSTSFSLHRRLIAQSIRRRYASRRRRMTCRRTSFERVAIAGEALFARNTGSRSLKRGFTRRACDLPQSISASLMWRLWLLVVALTSRSRSGSSEEDFYLFD